MLPSIPVDLSRAKLCEGCNTAKDLKHFLRPGRPFKFKTGVLEPVCRTCRRGAKYRKIREEVLSFYSGGTPTCKCCKTTYLPHLTLDHVSGGGNQERRKLGDRYWMVLLKRKAEGYQVLCMNCNWAKGHNGRCNCQAGDFRA